MTAVSVPTFDDITAAARRILGQAVRTPLLNPSKLDALTGARVFLKPENLQRTGSFKFRGAFNAVSQIPMEARGRGVVACSSGNHAQGVAEAARLHGIAATIVMPIDVPETKRAGTVALGADVVSYDRATEDRDAITNALVAERNATLVHPYDDAKVIAGQGTIGLEIIEDLAALGLLPDVVLICTGGGGLTAGVALAIKTLAPDAVIYSVEPEGFDDQRRSFEAGTRLGNASKSGSICDALMAPMPGAIGFEINRTRIARGLTVSDAEAMAAVGFAARELKLVLEPGGAVALAALMSGRLDLAGKTVAVILSGGNVDPATLAKAIG